MCLPEVAEKTRRTSGIVMGKMPAEVVVLTVGSAWLVGSLMGMMLMLVAEQVLMVKQYQRNALRIWSANGRWVIVIRPQWLGETGVWTTARSPPQMVGCWRRRSGAGILGGRFRLREKGDPEAA